MDTVLNIILIIGMIILGAVATYYRANAKLKEKVAELIDQAEGMFTDATKQGGKRFEWVVDQLYGITPAWLKPMLTREAIGNIVQTAFDWMQDFARQQLDKATDKITQ